ncbi:MAG: hypothetical protein Fues2KO_39770 [Fuerstiella sp.]
MNSVTQTEQSTVSAPADDRPVGIAGIGASAGGLKSIEELVSRMPDDTGLAFVIVQHLSPDFKSLMDEILARQTSMPVLYATDGMILEPNIVYLISPRKTLTVSNGRFVLTDSDLEQPQRPVDALFRSIAAAFGKRCIGVILSGTGTDGVSGVRAIYDAGGLTLVESPESAQFDGMPLNAIATECVHMVLPPAEIADVLINHAAGHMDQLPEVPQEQVSGINLIFKLLCDRHGIDFADYKATTVARRIERRLTATQSQDMMTYAERLRVEPREIDELYHDLLIGVTKFFRDSEAFFALQVQINQMVRQLDTDQELRIWVAGCATGEEAYTVAMIAVEAFDRVGRVPNLKILATDVHQGALDHAARGTYSAEALEFVTADRQARFFTPVENNRYRISADARRHLVFARHNVLDDPPFTRINVITCRNMLIYFQPKAQASAIASFHFALEENGIMMLGTSESAGRLEAEFDPIDSTWRIFRKLRSLPNLLASTKASAPGISQGPRKLVNILNRDRPEQLSFTGLLEAYDLLLGQYVECGLLLDDHRNVLHVFGDASSLLLNTTGRFTGNIMRLLDGEARTAIGAALVRSQKDPDTKFVLRQVPFEIGDRSRLVDVSVRTLRSEVTQGHIWFVEFKNPEEPETLTGEVVRITQPGDTYEALQSELAYTKESLSATIEELETSNEELQSTNEELIASNEELQSTNQELHSVNEELYSVNAENHRKITELQEVTEDIENLLSSTDIGSIFVDESLLIRKFTQAATHYFRLVSHDVGRPLTNFTHNLQEPELLRLVERVVDEGESVVRKLNTIHGDAVLLKIVPYRKGGRHSGAIINLVDLAAIEGKVE